MILQPQPDCDLDDPVASLIMQYQSGRWPSQSRSSSDPAVMCTDCVLWSPRQFPQACNDQSSLQHCAYTTNGAHGRRSYLQGPATRGIVPQLGPTWARIVSLARSPALPVVHRTLPATSGSFRMRPFPYFICNVWNTLFTVLLRYTFYKLLSDYLTLPRRNLQSGFHVNSPWLGLCF